MASQSNVAYDFDRFEIQRQPQRKPKLKVVTKKQQQRKNKEFIAKVAVCVAIFFVGVLGVIFSQVAITEITMKITACNQQLELLESDYRTLSAELESSMALNNIESTVTRENGMAKLREDQVTYVSFSDGDRVDELENHNPTLLEQLKKGLSDLMAYLSPEKIQWNSPAGLFCCGGGLPVLGQKQELRSIQRHLSSCFVSG